MNKRLHKKNEAMIDPSIEDYLHKKYLENAAFNPQRARHNKKTNILFKAVGARAFNIFSYPLAIIQTTRLLINQIIDGKQNIGDDSPWYKVVAKSIFTLALAPVELIALALAKTSDAAITVVTFPFVQFAKLLKNEPKSKENDNKQEEQISSTGKMITGELNSENLKKLSGSENPHYLANTTAETASRSSVYSDGDWYYNELNTSETGSVYSESGSDDELDTDDEYDDIYEDNPRNSFSS